MTAFLCHHSGDHKTVSQIDSFLREIGLTTFNYSRAFGASAPWNEQMIAEAAKSESMIVFIGASLPQNQVQEITTAWNRHTGNDGQESKPKKWIYVILSDPSAEDQLPGAIPEPTRWPRISYDPAATPEAIAKSIACYLRVPWTKQGLPTNPRLFSYEKVIIKHLQEVKQAGAKLFAPRPAGDDPTLDALEALCRDGAPMQWPEVPHVSEFESWKNARAQPHENRLLDEEEFPGQTIGIPREDSFRVSMSATFNAKRPSEQTAEFSLPEAGPRKNLWFPRGPDPLKVGILVSGGIAPGINAVIDGITQQHWLYRQSNAARGTQDPIVCGFLNGFSSLIPNGGGQTRLLAANTYHKQSYSNGNVPGVSKTLITSDQAHAGGSMIGTSRVDAITEPGGVQMMEQMVDALVTNHGIDILYVIGGDGSMRAAHSLWTIAKQRHGAGQRTLSVVGVPKTMDNDVLWVWQSFGFMSAVDEAREVIETLYTEVSSNPRLGVVQLFGSVSGFVVSHAVLASSTGHCELALIPEVPFSIEGVALHMSTRMKDNAQNAFHRMPFGLIVMAETAIPTDVRNYLGLPPPPPLGSGQLDAHAVYRVGLTEEEEAALTAYANNQNCVVGQTSDALRSAGLKLVSIGVTNRLKASGHGQLMQWPMLRQLTNEPRHMLRSVPPSCADIINCQRLGTLAVDNAMAGYTDFMISQWLTEYVLVPLSLVVLGRKQIHTPGIFWKSVMAKTRQHQSNLNQQSVAHP